MERVTLYPAIRRNRRDSLLLFVGVSLLFGLVGLAIGGAWGSPSVGLALGIGIATFQGLIGWFAGDEIVLSMSKAREITHADHPRLFNVVDEMRIAAGLPMPRVFIIEDSAPNAFATGKNPQKSVIAVTTGLLEKLNREELQGVMGHEMSHIRNGDIRFGILIAILVGAIVLLCDSFWRGMRFGGRHRSNRREGGNAGTAIFFALAVILALLAPLFAKMIQMAWSRQREYLADASGVELTRNPLGLASALNKIAHDPEPLEVANRATQHLYIVNPVKPLEERAKFLFSTHPPVEQRIARLQQIAGLYAKTPQSFVPSKGQ